MPPKNIPDSGFPDDDGSADPRLAAALTAFGADPSAEDEVLAALPGARLLVPVVALLGETEEGPGGLRREKTSDMAVPTIEADGRRALPAFTSTASLARWRADARPVAVPLGQALQALVHEKADTLLVDIAGPVPYALTGAALRAVAAGRGSGDPLADPAVRAALRTAVAGEPDVLRAHLVPSAGSDGTLGIVLGPAADVRAVAQRVSAALAGDEVLRGALVRGIELALLPDGATLPGEPLFTR
ncbi:MULTISPECIES: SseB family protein [unclassified Streptomyces]|uniref:SseB family protein n=1 Tax=unclassified Streptomyces TaxID=2593676 RepID=UPI0038228420